MEQDEERKKSLEELKKERMEAFEAKVKHMSIWEDIAPKEKGFWSSWIDGFLATSPPTAGGYWTFKGVRWVYEKVKEHFSDEVPLKPFPANQPIVYHFHPVAFVEGMKRMEISYKWAHSPFGNLLAEKESRNDYNICNRISNGIVKEVRDVEIVRLTIEEIQTKQKNKEVFAVGRFQLIPMTLQAAIDNLGLDTKCRLDEGMQDRIFQEFLIDKKRPAIIRFLEKDGDIGEAMYTSALEWASVGVEKGKKLANGNIANGGESYYHGDGLNKAHISPEEIKMALEDSKNNKK